MPSPHLGAILERHRRLALYYYEEFCTSLALLDHLGALVALHLVKVRVGVRGRVRVRVRVRARVKG